MKREEVYKVIDTERDFQEDSKPKDESHIVEDFPLGSGLSAIQHKLDIARSSWYSEQDPYPMAMKEIRKIAAICVQMGEKYGMENRESNIIIEEKDETSPCCNANLDRDEQSEIICTNCGDRI